MADEIALTKATEKAAQAQRLLTDPLYVESFNALEAQLIQAWIASDPRDADGRERCWLAVHANRKQRDYFASFVNNGKMAQAQLDELAKQAERRKRFG
jgi:ribonuclease HI